MTLTKTQIGWLQAFLAILVFLGLNQVMGRFSAVILHVNPVIYSCAAFGSCALVLLLRAGHGPLAKETMRSVDTWVYGVILMFSYIIGMLLFALVTSTEGTMLQKVSVLLGVLGSWFFLGRKPDYYQIIGTGIISFAVVMVAVGIEGQNIGAVYLLAFLYGLLQVARIFAAELHRPHTKAAQSNDPRSRARVVGFVMFIISIIFLGLTFLIALAQEMQPVGNQIPHLPTLKDFAHAPTIFAGIVAGIFIVAPSRMLEFSSSYIIKGENFTTVTSLSFISTLFWEWATSPITGLSIKEISSMDILAGGLITAGGLFIALTRKLAKKNKIDLSRYLITDTQNIDAVDDSREILANSLEHFNADLDKTAKALDLPKAVLIALYEDKEKVLAFNPEVLKTVARNYRRKVAMSDALTGLANRAGFMTALKGAAYEADIYSLLFIDLNKFKPVNDTYGHDAGDAILKGVAERLTALFPKRALATRLGGDEFAVLLLDSTKEQAQAHVASIKESLSQPFNFKGTEITIGASVGISTYSEDGTNPEALLKLADEGMYEEKKER